MIINAINFLGSIQTDKTRKAIKSPLKDLDVQYCAYCGERIYPASELNNQIDFMLKMNSDNFKNALAAEFPFLREEVVPLANKLIKTSCVPYSPEEKIEFARVKKETASLLAEQENLFKNNQQYFEEIEVLKQRIDENNSYIQNKLTELQQRDRALTNFFNKTKFVEGKKDLQIQLIMSFISQHPNFFVSKETFEQKFPDKTKYEEPTLLLESRTRKLEANIQRLEAIKTRLKKLPVVPLDFKEETGRNVVETFIKNLKAQYANTDKEKIPKEDLIILNISEHSPEELVKYIFRGRLNTFDHIKLHENEGSTEIGNGIIVCAKCNNARYRMPLDIFMARNPEVRMNFNNYLKRMKNVTIDGVNYVQAIKSTLAKEAPSIFQFISDEQ